MLRQPSGQQFMERDFNHASLAISVRQMSSFVSDFDIKGPANMKSFDTKTILILGFISLFHLVTVPVKLSFFTGRLYGEVSMWIWIACESILIDLPTIIIYSKELKKRTRIASDIGVRRLSEIQRIHVQKSNRYYNHIWNFIQNTPALETIVFIGFILTHDAKTAFLGWCVSRIAKTCQITKLQNAVNCCWFFIENNVAGINRATIRFVVILGVCSVLAHVLGSFWHMFATPETSCDSHGQLNSWTDEYVDETCPDNTANCGICHGDLFHMYLVSVYWATTSITTLGYGDIAPVTLGETCFVMLAELIAFSLYCLLLSDITSLISNADAARLAFNRRVSKIRGFLKASSSSNHVTSNINHYFEHLWSIQEGFEDVALTNQLPLHMQSKLRYSFYITSFGHSPLFQRCDLNLLSMIIGHCEATTYLPGERIYFHGTRAMKLFGVCFGTVNLYDQSGETEKSLLVDSGKFFGHFEFILKQCYLCDAYASKVDVTEIFHIDQEIFSQCCSLFESTSGMLEAEARKYLSNQDWHKLYTDTSKNIQAAPPALSKRMSMKFRRLSSESLLVRSAEIASEEEGCRLAPTEPLVVTPRRKTRRASINTSMVVSDTVSDIRRNSTRRDSLLESSHSLETKKAVTWKQIAKRARPILLLICVVFQCMLIPIRIGFFKDTQIIESMSISYIVDAVFVLDLLLEILSKIEQNRKQKLMNPEEAAKQQKILARSYSRISLIIDSVSLVPIDLVYIAINIHSWDPLYWAFLRIIRTVRSLHFNHYFSDSESFVGNTFGRIDANILLSVRLTVVTVIMFSWTISIWTFLGKSDGGHKWSHDDQVVSCKSINCTFASDSFLARSLYWSVTTMTTVGYGDISPHNATEIMLATVSMFIGCLVIYPMIVGNISVLQGGPSDAGEISKNGGRTHVDILIERTRSCGSYLNLPAKLQSNISTYLEHQSSIQFDRAEIYDSLPQWLGIQVSINSFGALVTGQISHSTCTPKAKHGSSVAPLKISQENPSPFRHCSRGFIGNLCYNLKPMYGSTRQLLICKGEAAMMIYFVQHGALQSKTVDGGDGSVEYKSAPDAGVFRMNSNLRTNGRKENRRSSRVGSAGSFINVCHIVTGMQIGAKEVMNKSCYETTVHFEESSQLLGISAEKFHQLLQMFPQDEMIIKTFIEKGISINQPNDEFDGMEGIQQVADTSDIHSFDDELFSEFGDSIEEEDEIRYSHGKKSMMIYPRTRLRLVVDSFTILFLIQTLILVPFGVGAISNEHCTFEKEEWIRIFVILNMVGDSFLFLVLMLNSFFFAAHELGHVLTDRWSLCTRYLKSKRGMVDLICALPIDWIAMIAFGGFDHLYQSNWIRFIKFLHIFNLSYCLGIWENMLAHIFKIKSNSIQLLNLFFLLCFFSHSLACFWIRLISIEEGVSSWPLEDCVMIGTCFNETDTSMAIVEKCNAFPLGLAYLRSCYYILVTLNTVGYGDVTPTNLSETIFATLVMLLGAIMYASLLSSLAKVVADLDKTATNFKKTREDLRKFTSYRRLPQALGDKITSYIDQTWRNHRGGTLEQIFTFLSQSLRLEAIQFLLTDQLSKVGLLSGLPKCYVTSLTRRLVPFSYSPGDKVFRAGNPSEHLYILVKGDVILLAEDAVTTLSKATDKGVFGEEEFFGGLKFHASLQCSSYCDILQLSRKDFFEINEYFPDADEILSENTEKMALTSDVIKLAGNLKSKKLGRMMKTDESKGSDDIGILPLSPKRKIWEHLMMLVTLYIGLSVPFRIGFLSQIFLQDAPGLYIWILFDVMVISGMSIVDMYFHAFKFAFFREGAIVASAEEIKTNYKTKWMMGDLIATLPFDVLALCIAMTLESTNSFEIWSLCRLLTVWRCFHRFNSYYLPLFEYYFHERGLKISAIMMRLVSLIITSVIAVHWISCMWYRLAVAEGIQKSWAFKEFHLDSIFHMYVRSLYWGLTTLTTVGYGDIVPLTAYDTAFAILALFCGLYLYVSLVANITTLISNADSSSSKRVTLMNAIKKLLIARETSVALSSSVVDFLESDTLLAKYGIQEDMVLNTLPTSIRNEISEQMHLKVLKGCKCFGALPYIALTQIAHSLKNRTLVPGEIFGNQGDSALELCLIFTGSFKLLDVKQIFSNNMPENNVLTKDGNPGLGIIDVQGKQISDGGIIGYEMIVNQGYSYTSIATSVAEIYVLSKSPLNAILEHCEESISQKSACLKSKYL